MATLVRKASTLIPSMVFDEDDVNVSSAKPTDMKVAEEDDGIDFDFGTTTQANSRGRAARAQPVASQQKQVEFFNDIAGKHAEQVEEYASSMKNSKLMSMRERLQRRALEIEAREKAKLAEAKQDIQLPESQDPSASESEEETKSESSSSESSEEEEESDQDNDDDVEEDETAKERAAKKKLEDEELQRVLNEDVFARQKKEKTLEFAALRLSRPLNQAIRALNFTVATPVQAAAIPVALSGVDILANAATGSGKTVAFLVPIIERLLQAGSRQPAIRALILSPTRELSEQIFTVAQSLVKFTDIRVCCVVGGLPMNKQASELRARPDIVVATPGRMIDHVVNTMNVGLEDVEMLVLDEADRLLEMGFVDETKELVKACPKSRQTLLFSATLTGSVEELIHLSLRNPKRITIDSETSIVDTLTQEFIRIQNDTPLLRQAIVVALCTRTFKTRTIIFTKTKSDAHTLMIIFGLCKLNAAELHGNLTQVQRTEALELFRQNKVDFLICTDLAARGIDIKGVQTVINMYLPRELPQYIHRVGRTARAGNHGCSVSLITDNEKRLMKMIMKSAQNVVRKRVVPPSVISKYSNKIAELAPEVEQILQEESAEKQIAEAEMKATKAQNLIDHRKEILSRPAREWFQTKEEREAAKNAAPLIAGKRNRDVDDVDGSSDTEGATHVTKKVDLTDVKTRAELKAKLEATAKAEKKAQSKQERLSLEELKARTAELEAQLAAAKEKAKAGEKDPFRGMSRDKRRRAQIKLQEELVLREEQTKLAEHEEKVAAGATGLMTEREAEKTRNLIKTLKNPLALGRAAKKQAVREEREMLKNDQDGAGPDAFKRTLKAVEANERAARRAAKERQSAAEGEDGAPSAAGYGDGLDDVYVKQGVSAKHRRYADHSSAQMMGRELSQNSRFREAQQAFDRRMKIHEHLDAERRKPKAKGGFKSLKRHKRR